MPVLPDQKHPFQDPKTLYYFLAESRLAIVSPSPPPANPAALPPAITTVAFEIDPIDPLTVVQQAIQAGISHTYLEKPSAQEAIAGFGIAHRITAEGPQRFQTLQRRLAAWNSRLSATENLSNQRFFGSFTFFDQGEAADAPFAPAQLILPQWQIIRRQSHYQAIAHLNLSQVSNLDALTDTLWQQFQLLTCRTPPAFPLSSGLNPLSPFWQISELQSFPQAVLAALQAIQQNHVHKLVLAHAIDVVSPIPWDTVQSLHNLRQWHPDCWIFSVSHGPGQTFLGASPETLVQIHDRRFTTDALAGSAARGHTLSEDASLAQQLMHSTKERHEHQIVVDFLCDRLTQLGISPHCHTMPKLRKLSNIQHLHTPIHGQVPAYLQALDILATLHPTPAVAGIPPAIAMELIRRYEGFGRSLYAAPIGWIDASGNAEFLVGIRSALLSGHEARLFAGAGIVSGSDPLREQAEVKLKLQALLRALA